MTPARRWVLIGGAILAVLALAVYLVAALASGDTAAPGTTVQGVAIGGMTSDEAAAAVEDGLGPVAAKKLRVTALDQTFVVKPAEAGLALDAAASVAPAFGRKWNPVELIGAVLWEREFPAVVAVDQAALDTQLGVISAEIDIPPVEPAVVVEDGEPVLTPGTAGRAIDRPATTAALTAAAHPAPRADHRARDQGGADGDPRGGPGGARARELGSRCTRHGHGRDHHGIDPGERDRSRAELHGAGRRPGPGPRRGGPASGHPQGR